MPFGTTITLLAVRGSEQRLVPVFASVECATVRRSIRDLFGDPAFDQAETEDFGVAFNLEKISTLDLILADDLGESTIRDLQMLKDETAALVEDGYAVTPFVSVV